MELTSKNVEEVFEDCRRPLELEDRPMDTMTEIEGIIQMFVFNQKALDEHRDDIESMLLQLPTQFRQGVGGGWSFLNACNREDGVQWTGEHVQMERLFAMGMGIGKVACVMPRDMWPALPGGMPYYVIKETAEKATT